jgi:hypothetical protein
MFRRFVCAEGRIAQASGTGPAMWRMVMHLGRMPGAKYVGAQKGFGAPIEGGGGPLSAKAGPSACHGSTGC